MVITSPDMGIFTLGFSVFDWPGPRQTFGQHSPGSNCPIFMTMRAEQYGLLALSVSGIVGTLFGSILGGLMAFELELAVGLLPWS